MHVDSGSGQSVHISFYHDGLIYNFEIICSDLDTYQNYNPNHKWSGDETDWDGEDVLTGFRWIGLS